jgi:hypothetical protein
MIQVVTIDTAPILIPNLEHKNFTEGSFVIPKGVKLSGDFKVINGLRRGKPFDYRVFVTDKEEIIYTKYIKPMENTEVTLGADAQVQATKVDIIPAENSRTMKNVIGSATGGVLGYAIAKKQGLNSTKTLLYAGVGAIAGFLIVKQLTKKQGIIVKSSK